MRFESKEEQIFSSVQFSSIQFRFFLLMIVALLRVLLLLSSFSLTIMFCKCNRIETLTDNSQSLLLDGRDSIIHPDGRSCQVHQDL